jgi:hypothetical protein
MTDAELLEQNAQRAVRALVAEALRLRAVLSDILQMAEHDIAHQEPDDDSSVWQIEAAARAALAPACTMLPTANKEVAVGTKNNPGNFDNQNADPDEPMFVLLARDKVAPILVWLWVALRDIQGEDFAKLIEARHCSMDMYEWAVQHGRQPLPIHNADTLALLRKIIDKIAKGISC